MKRNLSSNYLLNRYSYCIYTPFCIFSLYCLKDAKLFIIITVFYISWIVFYGSFHFREQTKVERIDYQTLRFVKGGCITEITSSDIAKIYIQKIEAVIIRYYGGYKVLVMDKNNEKYRFTYIFELSDSSCPDLIDSFLYATENFWGLANRRMILLPPNILFCN